LVALVAETANMFAAFVAPDTGVKPPSLGGRLGLLSSSTFDGWIPEWVVRFGLLILIREHFVGKGLAVNALEIGKERVKKRLHFTLSLVNRAAR
jgi:hypothetical protein